MFFNSKIISQLYIVHKLSVNQFLQFKLQLFSFTVVVILNNRIKVNESIIE